MLAFTPRHRSNVLVLCVITNDKHERLPTCCSRPPRNVQETAVATDPDRFAQHDAAIDSRPDTYRMESRGQQLLRQPSRQLALTRPLSSLATTTLTTRNVIGVFGSVVMSPAFTVLPAFANQPSLIATAAVVAGALDGPSWRLCTVSNGLHPDARRHARPILSIAYQINGRRFR